LADERRTISWSRTGAAIGAMAGGVVGNIKGSKQQ